MNVLLIFLSLLTPLMLGFLVLSLLWPNGRSLLTDFALKCSLSVGVGFGISSCLVFLWMKIMGQLDPGYFICEFLLILALCVVLVHRGVGGLFTPVVRPRNIQIPPSRKPYWLRAAVGIACISAIIQFAKMSLENPYGQFDAYAIWNLRARFLYSGGSDWTKFTYMAWSHPDYPLLIPASIARSWEFIGKESLIIPVVIAFLFTFSLIALVSLSISRLRGERQGLLASLVLLGTPFLLSHGSSQYADVPLSFFFAATVVLLLLYADLPSRPNLLIVAGLACGLAGWTKNEGILFSVAFFLSHALIVTTAKGRSRARKEAMAWLAGIAPVAAVVTLYKISLGGSNDVISAHGLIVNVHKLLDGSRYLLISREFGKGLFTFGHWSRTFPIPLLLVFYFLLLGSSVEERFAAPAVVSLSLPVMMIAAYFGLYLITPKDLSWHLGTSLNRLLLQVWPLAILAYFVVVRTPGQVITTKRLSTTAAAQG